MSASSRLSDLCGLINHSLRHYIDTEEMVMVVISLTKEKEKDLLITLSQIFREIQVWTRELESDSDQDSTSNAVSDKTETVALEPHHKKDNCLIKILADMILLLTVENQFIQHLAGNILLAMSEFVAKSGSEWIYFIHSLCICLELVITNMLSCSSGPSPNCDSLTFVILKPCLRNANWSTAAGIIRVLRNILKYLKEEEEDELLEVFLGSVSSFLSNVPWDFMNEIFVAQSSHTQERSCQNSSFTSALFFQSFGEKEPTVVLMGHFIQFLCSLVEVQQSNEVEVMVGAQDQHPVCIIISLVPKLLCCCLGFMETSISLYFRHKLLMLMLRLSYKAHLGCSTLLSWLQLLHDHFEELLWNPITELVSGQDKILEGSPFLLSHSRGEACGKYSLHSQRQAVLLFLRCCFSLISLSGENREQCACVTRSSFLTSSSIVLDCYSRKKGFIELYKWLQWHLPIDVFVDREVYLEKCIKFASSFIQLYICEDDLLFKVLLQLLSVSSCTEQRLHEEKWQLQDVNEDTQLHVSIVFNPVHLFHLFLTQLHYDHQVLLDYLISKDTGISCAEYLLRSLRTICESWHLFTNFSMKGKPTSQSSHKKQKTLLVGSNSQVELLGKTVPPSLEEECERDPESSCKHYKTRRQPFKKAQHCLLSLKDSVENLHKKNLFPYNPEALLRRLSKFEELCFNGMPNDPIGQK